MCPLLPSGSSSLAGVCQNYWKTSNLALTPVTLWPCAPSSRQSLIFLCEAFCRRRQFLDLEHEANRSVTTVIIINMKVRATEQTIAGDLGDNPTPQKHQIRRQGCKTWWQAGFYQLLQRQCQGTESHSHTFPKKMNIWMHRSTYCFDISLTARFTD